jgi:hypothetical protein
VSRAPVGHVDGGLHGAGAEPVQGFLAGVSPVDAWDGRRTSFGPVAGADRGGGVETLSRKYCSTVCRSLMALIARSWPAASRSMLRLG